MAYFDVKVVYGVNAPLGRQEWNANWQIEASGATGVEDFTTIAEAFASFHRGLLFSYYDVDRVVISTVEADSKPYDPSAVFSLPVAMPGLETPTGVAFPLTDVIHVRKLCGFGRNGHLFLRGGLATDNVTSSSGVPRLVSPSAINTALITAFGVLTSAIEGLATVVMVNKTGSVYTSRQVYTLTGAVLSASSTHRPRKPSISPASPFAKMGKLLTDAKAGADVVNGIIEVFNALPVIPDVPLLP